MSLPIIISISLGASLGALLRWVLGMALNPLFPTLPLGTLAANLIGGLLMGIFMGITRNHFIPEMARLALATGFLGGLTTFSTFSAETVTLLAHQEYLFSTLLILSHVVGSILATILGIYIVKIFTS